MRLDFQMNKYYILTLLAEGHFSSENELFLRLRKLLHDHNFRIFSLVAGGIGRFFLVNGRLEKINGKSIRKFFDQILRKQMIQKLVIETEAYLNQTKKQWLENYYRSKTEVEKIIKIKIPETTLKVLIVHPEFQVGRSFPQYKTIIWGHKEDWPNYSTVYLWHEILHWLTFKKYQNPKVIHSLIELAIDNELRIRLNKKGRYFKENKLPVGHAHLKHLEKKYYLSLRNILGIQK